MKMSNRLITLTVSAGLMCATGATLTAHAKSPDPLFTSDDIIKIRITGPISDITKNAAKSTAAHPGTLSMDSPGATSHAIQLSARGNSRRRPDVCKFPPLRVKFDTKPKNGVFDGQKSLKLVTHCSSSKSMQKVTGLEYTAYKLLNVMTPHSLNVRMAEVDYIDSGSGKSKAKRFGFFIEDTDDAAKRNGNKEIDTPDIGIGQLASTSAAKLSLFQYMIGNLDWSAHHGVTGKDCCHNTKLTGATKLSQSNLIPIPYDFDYAGLVNAPYAVPPESLKVRSVTQRLYRGFCVHNPTVRQEAASFLQKRPALEAAIAGAPALRGSDVKKATKFLGRFFETLEDPAKFEKNIIQKCRG